MKILFILGTVIYILTGNIVLQYFLLGVGLYLLFEWLLVSSVFFTATLIKAKEVGHEEVSLELSKYYQKREEIKTEIKNYLNIWEWL